jgi:hypothetical protein
VYVTSLSSWTSSLLKIDSDIYITTSLRMLLSSFSGYKSSNTFYNEERGSRFLRKVRKHLTDYRAFISQKNVILRFTTMRI